MKGDFYSLLPTQEDLLDINFRSIISDCRGIISGNLVPRSYAELSTTWKKEGSVDGPGPIFTRADRTYLEIDFVRRNIVKAQRASKSYKEKKFDKLVQTLSNLLGKEIKVTR